MEEGKNHPKGSGHGGKYNRLPKEYREKLSSALPREAIKTHPTKTFLSTIKQIFITERLNDVFGIGGWDFEHNILGIYDNDTYTRTKTKSGKVSNVIVAGRLYAREVDLYTPLQYGGGDIEGYNTDPSDGFKGAVTDCMSKCLRGSLMTRQGISLLRMMSMMILQNYLRIHLKSIVILKL